MVADTEVRSSANAYRTKRTKYSERLTDLVLRWVSEGRFELAPTPAGIEVHLTSNAAYGRVVLPVKGKAVTSEAQGKANRSTYERMLSRALPEVDRTCQTLEKQSQLLDKKDKQFQRQLCEALGESARMSRVHRPDAAERWAPAYSLPGNGKQLLQECRTLRKMWTKDAKNRNKSLEATFTLREELKIHRYFSESGYEIRDVRNKNLTNHADRLAELLGRQAVDVRVRLAAHRLYLPLACTELYGDKDTTEESDFDDGDEDESEDVDIYSSGPETDTDIESDGSSDDFPPLDVYALVYQEGDVLVSDSDDGVGSDEAALDEAA